ncbi:CapA family protein [bacterium]|nr:CapA family protein [bacterium]
MKITYRVSKSNLSKKQPLEGVRKGNQQTQEQITKAKETKLKKFDPTRVLLTTVLVFLVEILVLYLINFPIVRWSIDYITRPGSQLPTISYKTIRLQLASEIPETTRNEIQKKLESIEFNGTKRFTFVTENPEVTIKYSAEKQKNDLVLSQLYLVPVGHLYWIKDDISKTNVLQDEIIVPTGKRILYNEILSKYAGKEVKLREASDVSSTLKNQEKSFAMIDFFDLNGQYKLLKLDGKYFFEDAPNGGIPYYLVIHGDSVASKNIVAARAAAQFPESFSKDNLLSLRMTGVTAITRGLGIKTNASGDPAYASRKIGAFLSKADLTHVSNEISMVPHCAPAGGVSFCMVSSHIEALKKSGVDIVELTGNHNNDKGSTYNTATIQQYKNLGWSYFGGGLNAEDASKILYKEVKGTKIAFLGYNFYDTILGTGALAGKSRAGANSWSAEKITRDVAEARKNGADVVVVDFQYQECWSYTDTGATVQQCYGPITSPNQKKDFRQAVDAGADIVIGTQAHQPQTYEIYKGKSIFYGLGNLYFDQTQQLGTRQGLILTHYMYKGKYLGTGITTTIYDSDLLTYITTGNQRVSFLNSLKAWRPKN